MHYASFYFNLNKSKCYGPFWQKGSKQHRILRHDCVILASLPATSVQVSEDVARLAHALETALTEGKGNYIT